MAQMINWVGGLVPGGNSLIWPHLFHVYEAGGFAWSLCHYRYETSNFAECVLESV